MPAKRSRRTIRGRGKDKLETDFLNDPNLTDEEKSLRLRLENVYARERRREAAKALTNLIASTLASIHKPLTKEEKEEMFHHFMTHGIHNAPASPSPPARAQKRPRDDDDDDDEEQPPSKQQNSGLLAKFLNLLSSITP